MTRRAREWAVDRRLLAPAPSSHMAVILRALDSVAESSAGCDAVAPAYIKRLYTLSGFQMSCMLTVEKCEVMILR